MKAARQPWYRRAAARLHLPCAPAWRQCFSALVRGDLLV